MVDAVVFERQKGIMDVFAQDARFIVWNAVDQMNWFRQCGGVPGNYAQTAKNYEAKYGDSGDGWEAIMNADMNALNKAMDKFCDLNKIMNFSGEVVKELFGY